MYLSEIVYGGLDGIITTFVIIAGSSGASFSSKVTILLGLASTVADGFSMGVSAYLAEKVRENPQNPYAVGAVTCASFVLLGVIPLVPFIVHRLRPDLVKRPLLLSGVLTLLLLVALGLLKGRVENAIETVVVGSLAAVIAYYITKQLNKYVAQSELVSVSVVDNGIIQN